MEMVKPPLQLPRRGSCPSCRRQLGRGPKDLATLVWTSKPAASEVRADVETAVSAVRADVMMMDVLLVALVQGQVAVIFLQVMSLLLLLVLAFVEEVLLFALPSTPTQTTNPRTRPAGRCLGLGR